MRDVLTFVSLMKEIEFVLKLQEDIPTVLFSLFEKPVTIYKEKQGEISLADSLQIRSCMKHITIKYNYFRSSLQMMT